MKKITLEQWAKSKFDPPPCRETQRRWARDCKIFPVPQKIGRAYYVEPNARYIDPTKPNYGT